MSGTEAHLHRSYRSLPKRAGLVGTVGIFVTVGLLIGACSSGPKRDAAAFCTAYVDVARRGVDLADPDDVSIAAMRTQVRAIDDAASDAARRAPDDISGSVDTVIAPLHTLRKGVDAAKNREAVTDALAAYREKSTSITTDQQRLDAWVSRNCGVVSVTTTTVPLTLDPSSTGVTG